MAGAAIEARHLFRWLIKAAASWARRRAWGEITVQFRDGQIVGVTETVTHRELKDTEGPET